ncbi:MAG: dienelactone hydrolase family protein [Chitinophagaceae bacterium]
MRKEKLFLLGSMLAGAFIFASCGNESGQTPEAAENKKDSAMVKEEAVSYTSDTVTLNGFVAYDQNSDAKRPVVLIVHEWWGLNDYVRNRAKQLADMGYLAMAVDMYGNGKTAANPQEAMQLSGPFYKDPQLAKARFDAALNKIKEYPQADTANIAAIGYCFGGSMVLTTAKMGENMKGVVSFHGGLAPIAPADKSLLKAKILVCHGGADSFVPQVEVDQFKKQMDSIGADYTFKVYDSATHAFTNPDATEAGKKFNLPIAYNPAADKASWEDMKAFFGRIFK